MSNHTPGPWRLRGCDGGWAIDFNDDQEQVVDYVYEEADARLIAAAPELLAALQMTRDCLAKCLTGGEVSAALAGRALTMASEAVSKATGE
ncbi:TPA: hypothetical protein ACXIEW_002570 [Pseudomonas aeruginosa]